MVAQRTAQEMSKASILKAARSAVRLRKSIEADHELNEVLPRVEKAFERALAEGEPFTLNTLDLMLGALNEADY
jgi:hypothetical protein